MSQITEILQGIPTTEKTFQPGSIIVHQGDIIDHIGIVISGLAAGVKYSVDGQEIVVSQMGENKIFGDVLSGANGFASPVTVQACSVCRVLFISYEKLLYSPHPLIHKVLQNMIQNISMKYFSQNMRLDILMMKSVREKVMTYLSAQKTKAGSNSFFIPLDRRLWADYLGVERSALSRELSRMKSEGIIDCKKNFFTVNF